MNNQVIA
jgi:hypothetical protein